MSVVSPVWNLREGRAQGSSPDVNPLTGAMFKIKHQFEVPPRCGIQVGCEFWTRKRGEWQQAKGKATAKKAAPARRLLPQRRFAPWRRRPQPRPRRVPRARQPAKKAAPAKKAPAKKTAARRHRPRGRSEARIVATATPAAGHPVGVAAATGFGAFTQEARRVRSDAEFDHSVQVGSVDIGSQVEPQPVLRCR